MMEGAYAYENPSLKASTIWKKVGGLGTVFDPAPDWPQEVIQSTRRTMTAIPTRSLDIGPLTDVRGPHNPLLHGQRHSRRMLRCS